MRYRPTVLDELHWRPCHVTAYDELEPALADLDCRRWWAGHLHDLCRLGEAIVGAAVRRPT